MQYWLFSQNEKRRTENEVNIKQLALCSLDTTFILLWYM